MILLSSLKHQTSEPHAALEAQMDVARHFQSREGYVGLLVKFFTLYEPLEKKLGGAANWQSLGWDFDARRKLPLLREDLVKLGLTESELANLPRSTDLPNLDSLGAAIGCLYVLEGSTLGGQVITRMIQKSPGIQPDAGGAFFAGYGAQTMPNWREFGAWAEQQAEKYPEIEKSAVEGAVQTFDCFSRWFKS